MTPADYQYPIAQCDVPQERRAALERLPGQVNLIKKGGQAGRFFNVCYLFFRRKRAANFINLPGKHDCTRLQGFDHRTFCVFFLKFCNSIVERRKLKM
jgi:hypothetical protein